MDGWILVIIGVVLIIWAGLSFLSQPAVVFSPAAYLSEAVGMCLPGVIVAFIGLGVIRRRGKKQKITDQLRQETESPKPITPDTQETPDSTPSGY